MAHNLHAVPKPAPRVHHPGYLAWLHDTQDCLLAGADPCTCGGFLNVVTQRFAVQAHHVGSRALQGDDRCVALCSTHHAEGHRIGWRSFEQRHHVNLRDVAAMLYAQFQQEGR